MFSKSQNSAMLMSSDGFAIGAFPWKPQALPAALVARTIAAAARRACRRLTEPPGALHFPRFPFVPAAMDLPALSLIETRVLGVLVEKQHTVPDTYPLTLNALVAGCNQKTSRDPVIDASGGEVQEAVDHLRQLSLVVETSGGRVMRYAQNIGRVLGAPSEVVALLAALMLRGPQTAAEIRQNAERMHRFSDVSSVESYLRELAKRPAGALVTELPRSPGSRETRWMHLLSGTPAPAEAAPAASLPADAMGASEVAVLKRNLDTLAREVAELRAALARVMEELGLTR
jgi:uncharacterized protein YceH (UPF0502 family)